MAPSWYWKGALGCLAAPSWPRNGAEGASNEKDYLDSFDDPTLRHKIFGLKHVRVCAKTAVDEVTLELDCGGAPPPSAPVEIILTKFS